MLQSCTSHWIINSSLAAHSWSTVDHVFAALRHNCKACLNIYPTISRTHNDDRRTFDCLRGAQSTATGSYHTEVKCTATASKILIHCLWHISLFMLREVWENMKLSQSGKHKFDSPGLWIDSILNYARFKTGTFDSPGFPPGGNLHFCVRGVPPWVRIHTK